MQDIIRVNQADNIAIALRPINKRGILSTSENAVAAAEDIPQGHKMAIKPIENGEEIMKYGFRIGYAKEETGVGQWVHMHNMKTALGDLLKYEYQPAGSGPGKTEHAHFEGFRRVDGKMGVRNEIWIAPAVSCVNSIAQALEKVSKKLVTGSIEGVVAFPYPYSCSQTGNDQEHTRTVLADMINRPNAGGMLVLGLGCENSNIPVLREYIGNYNEQRVKFLRCQDVKDEMETAMEVLEELAVYMGASLREKIDASELIIGMKCGGSNGLSGITANLVVGTLSDILISKGGTTILTKVPGMFGAETLLMNRCETLELFEKTVNLTNNFESYFTSYNQTIYKDPLSGNKRNGISTLEDRPPGCTQESGSALAKGVISYGESVKTEGLNLLSAPGNDLVAATALTVSEIHVALFITGHGTPFISLVPTIKISSDPALAGRRNNWIDFNVGRMVEDKSKEELAQELFDCVIEVAFDRRVKTKEVGFRDMAVSKQGVTL